MAAVRGVADDAAAAAAFIVGGLYKLTSLLV
jgi:hypothetical protein